MCMPAGSSAAPAASSQQQAVPPRPAPSGNVTANAPAAPTPSSAVANNGHSQSNTRSSATTAGNGAPQQQAPAPAAAPAVAAANANPRIPPRQPAGNGQAGPPAAAPADGENDEHRDLREKVQNFRVMLVRLALRLQHTMRSSIVQQVNYRSGLKPAGASYLHSTDSDSLSFMRILCLALRLAAILAQTMI